MGFNDIQSFAVSSVTNISKSRFIHEFETGRTRPERYVNTKTGQLDYKEIVEKAEISLEPGQTESFPKLISFEVAEHLALRVMDERGIDFKYDLRDTYGEFNANSDQYKIMLEILGTKKEDYVNKTKKELLEICKEKGIEGVTDKLKNQEIIDILNKTI